MSYQVIFDFLSVSERMDLIALSEGLVWEKGRLQTGYEKAVVPKVGNVLCNLLQERSHQALGMTSNDMFDAGWDNYILRYRSKSYAPKHYDSAPFGSKHFRLNAIISDAFVGGDFRIRDRHVNLREGDAVIFRPDMYEHSVTPVQTGDRYVWSFGVLK